MAVLTWFFNNAGVALGSTVEGATYEDLEWIVGINFWGVVYGTKEFLPFIKQTQDGHIINISSLFGLTAQPTQSGYNATKFAVRGFTESLRQELDIEKCGVSSLCVHPGGIRTNIAKAAKWVIAWVAWVWTQLNRFKTLTSYCVPHQRKQLVKFWCSFENKRRLLIGSDAKILDAFQRLFPTGYQRASTIVTKWMK